MASHSIEVPPLEGKFSIPMTEIQLHRENPGLYVENAHLVTTIRAELAKAESELQVTDWAHPLHAFTVFDKLPLDLRVTIWEWTCVDARVVEVSAHPKAKYDGDGDAKFYSTTLVPVIMHVNRDSRAAGLLWYTELVFSGSEKITFINWKRDVVYFTDIDALNQFIKSETHINKMNQVIMESLESQIAIEGSDQVEQAQPATEVDNHLTQTLLKTAIPVKAKVLIEHSALNNDLRHLAVNFEHTVILQKTIPGVHLTSLLEMLVIRYNRSANKDDTSTPLKIFNIEGTGSMRAAAHMESQCRRTLKARPGLKKICVKDLSRDKRVPLKRDEEVLREDELRKDEIARRSRFNEDLLIAASFQEELHKRTPK